MAIPIYDLSVKDDLGPRLLAGLGDSFLSGQRQAQQTALANRKMQIEEDKRRALGSLAGVDLTTPEGQRQAAGAMLAAGDPASAAQVMTLAATLRKQANEEKFTREFFGGGSGGRLGALGGGTVPTGGASLRSPGVQFAETEADVQRLEAEMEGRTQYGDPNQPRGLRNNNAGNIEAGNFAASIPGYQGSDGRFAKFATPEQGIQAADGLLQRYAARGLNTVAGIVNRWAPPSENNTGAYAASVAKELGVTPDQPLDMNNPETRRRLIQAKFRVENGSQPYGESVFLRAYGGAQPTQVAGAPAPVQPVQMAQAGGVASDAPAQGAAPAQFAVPGNGLPPNDPRPDLTNDQLQRFMAAPGVPDNIRTQAKFILDRRLRYSDENSPLKTENMRLQNEKLKREAAPDYQSQQEDRKLEAQMRAREKQAESLGLQGDDRKYFLANGRIPTSSEKLTNDQANAGLYADRMRRSNAVIEQPGIATAGMGIAGAAQRLASDLLPAGAGNALLTSQFQQLDQAQRDFVNAVLRRESGAVISPSEFDNARRQYFPQPGDSREVLAQKARNRQTAIDGISRAGGPAYAKENPPGTRSPSPRPDQPSQSFQRGQTATNPTTGQKLMFDGSQWVPAQ